MADEDLQEEERVCKTNRVLGQIEQTEKLQWCCQKGEANALNALEGKTVSRYWTSTNKVIAPRDLIRALAQHSNGDDHETTNSPVVPEYIKDSKKMCEMAREYHKELQKDGTQAEISLQRNKCIQSSLEAIKTKLTPGQCNDIKREITEDKIRTALKKTESYKSPGVDGITYKVWKAMIQKHDDEVKAWEKKKAKRAQQRRRHTHSTLVPEAEDDTSEPEDKGIEEQKLHIMDLMTLYYQDIQ